MKLTTTKIAELSLDPSNVRKHSRRNLDAIKASLRKFGQQKPIVVDAKGIVLAGNGTLTAAQELGWTEIQIVRTELAGVEATAFAIADNRTAELAEWEEDKLSQVLQSLKVEDADLLAATGYDAAEVDKMSKAEVSEDEVPEPPAEPITKAGDLWILGEHRLLCGDSTKSDDVERLMDGQLINLAFTSPPYASQRKYDESSGFKPIPPNEFVKWFEPIAANVKDRLAKDGSWFVNIKPAADGLDTSLYVFDLVCAHVRQWGWRFATEFCWERTGIPQQVVRRFKNQFEPVYQFALNEWKIYPEAVRHQSHNVPKAKGKGAGDTNAARRQGVASAVDGNEVAEGMAYPGNRLPTFSSTHTALGHSAAFPVGLPSFFIKAYTDQSDNVYEPFCGSGTTVIAAEQLGRKCYGMEISPAYCDVIVQRWENLTGKKAVLDKPTT
jgi:DNA modification methylase